MMPPCRRHTSRVDTVPDLGGLRLISVTSGDSMSWPCAHGDASVCAPRSPRIGAGPERVRSSGSTRVVETPGRRPPAAVRTPRCSAPPALIRWSGCSAFSSMSNCTQSTVPLKAWSVGPQSGELPVVRVEAPSSDAGAEGDDDAGGADSGTSISAVTAYDLFRRRAEARGVGRERRPSSPGEPSDPERRHVARERERRAAETGHHWMCPATRLVTDP
jgi:hypothetical protein